MELQAAKLEDSKLVFEKINGLHRALLDGCFYLKIPERIDLKPLVKLALNFHRDKSSTVGEVNDFREFKSIPDIYFDRKHFQTEHLLMQSYQREKLFPRQAIYSSSEMFAVARLCLRSILKALDINPELWSKLTSGSTVGNGVEWFAVSHYRTERNLPGCAPHQDTGFITVLFIDSDGLEARKNGKWVPIAARPGYFLINFGASFEHLTENWKTPVKAIYHRVRQIAKNESEINRISFAAFLNPPSKNNHYQIDAQGFVRTTGSVEAFLRDFNEKTWRDTHDEFGID